jgi:hypothetical protein
MSQPGEMLEEPEAEDSYTVTGIQVIPRALPAINGACLRATATTNPPGQPVVWSIIGDHFDCEVDPMGVVTAGDRPGIITIRAANPHHPANYRETSIHVIRVTIGDVVRDISLPFSVAPNQTIQVPVTIEPNLDDADHAVRFDVINCNRGRGLAGIGGNPVRKSTGVIAVQGGGSQTDPGLAGSLRVRARIDGAVFAGLSSGFSVCAHPVSVRNDNPVLSVDPVDDMHGMQVDLTVESDSGQNMDLNRVVEWEVLSGCINPTGSMVGAVISPPPVPAHIANAVEPDRHRSERNWVLQIHDRPQGGGPGAWCIDQLDVFMCLRCGMSHARVIPQSGYRVTRTIWSGPAMAVSLEVRKTPQVVTIEGYVAQEGPSNAMPAVIAPLRP